jgi:hypothetical protein
MSIKYNQHIEKESKESSDPVAAFLLLLLMKNISEKAYYAQWMNGMEYALWDCMTTGEGYYGQHTLTALEIDSLKYLSEKCKGWWYWNDNADYLKEETFIDIETWKTKHIQNG